MTTSFALTPEQVQRYSRHIIMPQVGSHGQRKLMQAKVLIVGAGGLGSPTALYLSLAGVGTVGLVDFDVVDISNLQRQILHQNADVGRPKVISASETINAYNPDVNVQVHEMPINSENAVEIISQYDIVVNGADNFATRYLVNDACYLQNKPLVDGSILMFDGQATVYLPGRGCYRCLFPAPPPPGRGAQLRRGRRAGRHYGAGREHSGDGDPEAHPWHRRVAVRTAAAHRRANDGLPHGEDPAEPELPPVRRGADGDRAD